MNELKLDKSARNTKNFWLACMCALLLFFLGWAFFIASEQSLPSTYSIWCIISFWFALYEHAYKRHGTFFLTLALWVSIIIGVTYYMQFQIYHVKELEFIFPDNLSRKLELFIFLWFIWWLDATRKLRSLNLQLQKNIILASDEYLNAQKMLNEASNLEDLQIRFGNQVRKLPQLHKYLQEIYSEKSKVFSRD
jgi:hypothetical protein